MMKFSNSQPVMFLVVTILVVVSCFAKSANGEVLKPGNKRPNIVMIMMDDMGVGDNSIDVFRDLSKPVIYNTPNMERVAKEGMAFSQSYSASAVCGPSRASLLTGLSPWKHFVRGNYGQGRDFQIPRKNTMFFEALKDQDYNVGYVGKWGFCDEPMERGIDIFFGMKGHKESHSFYPKRAYYHRNQQSIFAQPPPGREEPSNVVPSKAGITAYSSEGQANYVMIQNDDNEKRSNGKYYCEKLLSDGFTSRCQHIEVEATNKGMEILDELASAYKANKDTPFFLFLSSFIPHVGSWTSDEDDPQRKAIDYHDPNCPSALKEYLNAFGITNNEVIKSECQHKSMIENYIDQTVGNVLERLWRHDIDDDTLLIVTSDHGSERVPWNYNYPENGKLVHDPHALGSTGGLRGYKRTLYEGGTRVPTIMRWPGVIEANSVSDHLHSLYDIFPTLVELGLNVNPPSGLTDEQHREWIRQQTQGHYGVEGTSFVPVMVGKKNVQPKVEQLEYSYCEPAENLFTTRVELELEKGGENFNVTDPANAPLLREIEAGFCSWAVRSGDMKLYYNHVHEDGPTFELFNVVSDPHENSPLDITTGPGLVMYNDLLSRYDNGHVPFLQIFEPEDTCKQLWGTGNSDATKSPTISIDTPTVEPTLAPTRTRSPTSSPTVSPTKFPTGSPVTATPSRSPSMYPTKSPTTLIPTKTPTKQPTSSPTTFAPSTTPTASPTAPTTSPTRLPTRAPSVTINVDDLSTVEPFDEITIGPRDSQGYRVSVWPCFISLVVGLLVL